MCLFCLISVQRENKIGAPKRIILNKRRLTRLSKKGFCIRRKDAISLLHEQKGGVYNEIVPKNSQKHKEKLEDQSIPY